MFFVIICISMFYMYMSRLKERIIERNKPIVDRPIDCSKCNNMTNQTNSFIEFENRVLEEIDMYNYNRLPIFE